MQPIYLGKFCCSFVILIPCLRFYCIFQLIVFWTSINSVNVTHHVSFQTQDFPVMKQQIPKFQRIQLTGTTIFHKWRWRIRLLMYDLIQWSFVQIYSVLMKSCQWLKQQFRAQDGSAAARAALISAGHKRCVSQFTDWNGARRIGRNTWADESGVYHNTHIRRALEVSWEQLCKLQLR